jgi:ketosteroid isomerase-like protein
MTNHLATIREYYDRGERQDYRAIAARLIGDGYTWIDHTTDIVATAQEQLQAAMVEDLQSSDWRFVINRAIETADREVIVITQTVTGEWRGVKGKGQNVRREVCEIFRFDAEGRIVYEEAYRDALSVMRQLGAVSI